jgi:hypothetical protein
VLLVLDSNGAFFPAFEAALPGVALNFARSRADRVVGLSQTFEDDDEQPRNAGALEG